MRRSLALLAASVTLPLASWACGSADAGLGAADATGGSGHAGSVSAGKSGAGGKSGAAGSSGGSAGGYVAPLKPRGSFDLSVSALKQSFPMGTGNVKSPSDGASFRIDIPEPEAAQAGKSGKGTPTAWKALVTPRWGTPALFDVVQGEGSLTLTGSATVKASGVTDVWQSFVLALDASGLATGAVSAVGQESILLDGVGVSGKVTGSLTLATDHTAPEAKAASVMGFAGAQLLPWEPVVARFAEPVADAAASSHLSLVAGGESIGAAWTFGPEGLGAGQGIVVASGVLSTWDAPASAKLALASGYADLAGNAGMGFEQSVDFLSVPPAKAGPVLLAKDPSAFSAWGPTKADAACDTGACASLGPVWLAPCGVTVTGLAGRLEGVGAKTLRVRYRALFAETPESKGAPPYLGAVPVLAVSAARPGVLPVTQEQAAPETTDLGPNAGQFHYATPWTNADLPLPAGDGEIGWAVRAGGQAASAACDGKVTSVPMVVLVEFVAAM